MAMLRGISDRIKTKLNNIKTPSIIVACVRNLSESDIRESKLSFIDFHIENESLALEHNLFVPDERFGSVSKENINGREIIHKDKPKIKKDIYLGDRPNFGDWSKGSFSLWQRRDVYQKSFIQPRGLSINVEIQNYNSDHKTWKLIFSIDTPLLVSSATIEDDLIFSMSLLNEVARKYDLFSSDTTPDQIASARYISWEVFPPGERNIESMVRARVRNPDPQKNQTIIDRAHVIESLRPKQFVFGSEINNDYYGALFQNNLIVFENVKYGNATYILYDNWEDVSKLSRTEILNSDNNFDRIIHNSDWEKTLREVLKHRLRQLKRRR